MIWGRYIFPGDYAAPTWINVDRPKPLTVPADIAAAVRELESAAWVDGNVETEGTWRGREVARAALDAVILKHLRGEA